MDDVKLPSKGSSRCALLQYTVRMLRWAMRTAELHEILQRHTEAISHEIEGLQATVPKRTQVSHLVQLF